MTQEEKLSKTVKLADAMYYAAQQLSTDASHLKEAMEKWWQFKNVELKESEDERIRERLIEFFKDWGKTKSHCWSVSIPKILAWLENIPYTIDHEKREGFHLGYKAGLEKQGEQKPIINVPPREVILAIWDLGNEWKELTNGCISTEYGTQLDYIQKHWHESEYYLRAKQGEQKPAWSEEDEVILSSIINSLEMIEGSGASKLKIDWLKHIRNRIKGE